MRKNGFTLIELLAVLVILGILATIVSVTVFTSLKTAKIKAFEDDANMLLAAANNYYHESNLSGTTSTVPLLLTYTANNVKSQTKNVTGTCVTASDKKLEYTGKSPYSGNIFISAKGEVKMKIYDNSSKKCIVKDTDDKMPSFKELNQASCILTDKAC